MVSQSHAVNGNEEDKIPESVTEDFRPVLKGEETVKIERFEDGDYVLCHVTITSHVTTLVAEKLIRDHGFVISQFQPEVSDKVQVFKMYD